MNGFVFDSLTFRKFLLQLILPFLVTLFFLQGFRTFVVDIYIALFNILWEGTGEYLPLLGLLVFATPLIAILLHKKISIRYLITGSAILTAFFSLPISLQLPYEVELILASMVVAFFSIFLPFYLNWRRQDQSQMSYSDDAALLSISIILAFSYDILFRTLGTTYDISRILLSFPIQFVFVVIILWANYALITSNSQQSLIPSESSQNPLEEEEKVKPTTSRIAGIFTIAGIGAFLFLEHSLLLNPHNILRWAYPPYFLLDITITLILTLIVLIITAILLVHNKLRDYLNREKWYTMAIGNLILMFLLASLFFSGGWVATISIIAFQLMMIINLYFILQFTLHPSHHWSSTILCTAIFLTLLILLLWDVMFAFTFTYAYLGDIGSIFAGQAITIILSAAIILGITSTYSVYKLRRLKQ
ncbi:MAG: hypothetical protein ACFFDJ_03575 [Candidatus Odinarchaeota archaeon]